MIARRIAAVALVAFAVAALAMQGVPPEGDEEYRPRSGQPGKDVIWVPTPDALVTQMLRAAKTTAKDLVYDLGAGDGKIAIAAAKEFGARAVGIEYNPELAALARRNAERAGVADRVTIVTGDIFKDDFSHATVVTMYLLPELNLRLRPLLLRMTPGTRVVSHSFHMGEWEADEMLNLDTREAFLWVVPADVAGRWQFKEKEGSWEARVDIDQRFQRIGGTLTRGNTTRPLLGATIAGAQLAFTFVDSDGGIRTVRGRIDGDAFSGNLVFVRRETPVTGTRSKP
jgi:SAM-dependent methyltransferase